MKQLARVLVGVGLGSVPTWLKPYRALSTGERFRVDLARAVVRTSNGISSAARLMVIDEFGSTLDRTMAKTTSAALARLVRSNPGLRLVALTGHDDIVPWLEPDWVLRLGGGDGPRLERIRLNRPPLELRVERVPQAMWRLFARHHYLTGGLAASATCYAAWLANPEHESPVAFCAVAPALGWKKTKRITRLVTLPEFQGLGIGSRLLEHVAGQEASRGNRVTITASHPAILSHCSHSPQWRFLNVKKRGSTRQRFAKREIRSSAGRAVAAFEFVAAP
jgi:GNAT superfamily N-acetyltransferase